MLFVFGFLLGPIYRKQPLYIDSALYKHAAVNSATKQHGQVDIKIFLIVLYALNFSW